MRRQNRTLPLMPATRRRKKRSDRLIKLGLAAAVLVGLYAVIGFFVAPGIVRSQAEKRLSAALGRPVSIGKVTINPFTFAATVDDFNVREPGGGESFLGWQHLFADLDVPPLLRRTLSFRSIELTAPRARVVARRDGSLNFSDLLGGAAAGASPTAAPSTVRSLHIGNLGVSGATVSFADEGRDPPFATTLGPVSLKVTDFTTVGGEQAPYHFAATTEVGEKLEWTGWIQAAPFRSHGELSVSGIVLKKYAPYYASDLPVELADGRLQVRGRYSVSFEANKREMKLVDGSLDLRDLRVKDRATGSPVLELPEAIVRGVTADGLALAASIGEIRLDRGHLSLSRNADGTLSVASLLPGAAPAAPVPGTTPAPSKLPMVRVAEAALSGWNVEFEDRVPTHPVMHRAGNLSVTVKDFTTADGGHMRVDAGFEPAPHGSVHAAGTVAFAPLRAEVDVNVDALDVPSFNAYLEPLSGIKATQGLASITGRLAVDGSQAGAPSVGFTGQVWLERFGLADAAQGRELAGFSDLILSGVDAHTAPKVAVSVADVNLSRPYAWVTFDDRRQLNWSALARPASAPVPPEAKDGGAVASTGAAAVPTPGAELNLGRVVIADGGVRFLDHSMQPNVRVELTRIEGEMGAPAEAGGGRRAVRLDAKVADAAPLSIRGDIDPLAAQPFADVSVALKGVDLMPFGAYSGRYAGYDIADGSLSLDTKARVADGRVDAANHLTLDRFSFGAAVNSPEATSLPVRLGVALLKDPSGQIALDIPVQGDLSDPQFKVGAVALRVVTNLLAKAATSPFALLGAVVGSSDEHLARQDFEPGQTALREDQTGRLDTLARALAARPALRVELRGGFDGVPDGDALKLAGLRRQIRHRLHEERVAADPATPSEDQMEIAPEAFAAALKKMFDEKYPPGTPLGTQLPPPPVLAAMPSHAEDPWWRKIYDLILLRQAREEVAYKRAMKQSQQEYLAKRKEALETGIPPEEMTARLLEAQVLDPADLIALANARAESVRLYLMTAGHVAAERLTVVPPAETPATGTGAAVTLELR